ncbi:MAG: hypothetical protein WAO81_11670, partial [Methanosarcina flavescens]
VRTDSQDPKNPTQNPTCDPTGVLPDSTQDPARSFGTQPRINPKFAFEPVRDPTRTQPAIQPGN